MDKTAVGRKIAEIRKAKGYSQDQLAICLGLSFQAVSKWETGKAIPQRTVVDKLSGLLGYDFSLLIDDSLTPDEANEIINRQKDVLWEKAEKRMEELYGEDPPLRITNRYIVERNMLHRGKSVFLFDVIARVREAARKKAARFDAPGAECFVSWLMGATDVNPLEPHLRCPRCKRVEFHPEARDGWDLQDRMCECGGRMEPDGHDIPVETCVLGEGSHYEFFRCPVDTDFLEEAERMILSWGEQYFAMERYHEDGENGYVTDPETGKPVTDPETGKKIPCISLPMSALIFRPKKKTKIRKPERVSGPTELNNWGRQTGQPVIILQGGFIEPSYLSPPGPFRSSPDELVKPQILGRALEDYWRYHSAIMEERTDLKFPDYTGRLEKMTFGEFITLICSVNNLYMTSGPEELAGILGFEDMTEMPLSMEDLWKLISSRNAYPGYMSGAAGEILIKVRNGQYLGGQDYLPGVPDRDRKMFREMNLPDWFETYVNNIFSLCFRTPYISLGIQLLEDARRKIREGR